jgi:phage terminase Nu1 subunit (DNA packaging protein)
VTAKQPASKPAKTAPVAGENEIAADATVSSERLSELFGVHPKTVALWIKNGLPVSSRVGRANAIPLAEAIKWRIESIVADFERRLAEAQASPDIEALRARKLEAESRIAEAEADRVEGLQVIASDVEDAWSRIALSIREAVLSLAPRAVQAGTVTAEKEEELSDLCRDILRELAKAENVAA